MPFADVLLPVDEEPRARFPASRARCLVHASIVLRVPGGHQHPALFRSEALQVGKLRKRRRRRFFEHHVLAGGERLAGDPVAHLRRRADGDGFEVGRLRQQLGMIAERERVPDRQPALARDRRELEGVALGDDRQMLVLRDLAEPDDADAMHKCNPPKILPFALC